MQSKQDHQKYFNEDITHFVRVKISVKSPLKNEQIIKYTTWLKRYKLQQL